jgi:5'(3')-deoxyribonucleotidase
MVNWTKGVFKTFGDSPELKTGQNAADALGISRSEMWSAIAKRGAKWWADLEPHPWAKDFYEELCRIDEVVILTSPSHIASAHAGKAQWIKKFFGGNFRNYILTKRKDLLAKPGDILIDDHDNNCEAFTQAGGIGIIFPAPWNKAHEDSHRAMDKVLENISLVYPRYVPPASEEYVSVDSGKAT